MSEVTESAEDYLKTILQLQRFGPVHCVDVAESRGVSKASVSVATQKLRRQGYLQGETHLLVLTPSGRRLAEQTYERHCFFAQLLQAAGVDGGTAEAEACRLEHAISEQSFVALKARISRELQLESV